MGKAVRIRSLARSLGIEDDDLLIWLLEHAPEMKELHPAAFIPAELAANAETALGKPRAPVAPRERRCAECRGVPVATGAVLEPVDDASTCERCHGSVNQREALATIDAFAMRGFGRLLVVGGGPGTAEDLRALLGDAIELRIVDGDAHHDATQAEAELRWADVIAIWGGTILSHKVSKLFTDRRADFRDKLVSVSRRGVAALLRAVTEKVTGA